MSNLIFYEGKDARHAAWARHRDMADAGEPSIVLDPAAHGVRVLDALDHLLASHTVLVALPEAGWCYVGCDGANLVIKKPDGQITVPCKVRSVDAIGAPTLALQEWMLG